MRTLSSTLLAIAAFLLPFFGLGALNIQHRGLPIKPVDAFLILAVLTMVPHLLRTWQKLARLPLIIAVAFIAAGHILASFLSKDPAMEITTIVRQILMVSTVATICSLKSVEGTSHLNRIYRGLLAGGLSALAISLIGYILVLVVTTPRQGVNPFVFMGSNPFFHNWPRLSGTFGHSPQYLGQYSVALVSVTLSCYSKKKQTTTRHKIALILMFTCLTLTFSWAWLGGAILITGYALKRFDFGPIARFLSIFGLVLCALAGSWLINIGLPSSLTQEKVRQGVHHTELDTWHAVNSISQEDSNLHHPRLNSWPYARLETTYFYAKRVALQIIKENPIFGTGSRQYANHVREKFRKDFGTVEGTYYLSPHSDLLNAAATSGIPGVIAFLLFITLILKYRPRLDSRDLKVERYFLWLGVLGFLAMGLNGELIQLRSFWIMTGLLAATYFEQDQAPTASFNQ